MRHHGTIFPPLHLLQSANALLLKHLSLCMRQHGSGYSPPPRGARARARCSDPVQCINLVRHIAGMASRNSFSETCDSGVGSQGCHGTQRCSASPASKPRFWPPCSWITSSVKLKHLHAAAASRLPASQPSSSESWPRTFGTRTCGLMTGTRP